MQNSDNSPPKTDFERLDFQAFVKRSIGTTANFR
jgi:hypothetical protein